MKKHRRYIDGLLLVLALAVLVLLLMAPPATTPELPGDVRHRPLIDLALAQGKKVAEKDCESCHQPNGTPLPEDHPAGHRCLFCHRLPTR